MWNPTAPIGMMDTGVGGVYVLRRAQEIMPGEDFFFFADLKNAPYGSRTKEKLRSLTIAVGDALAAEGIKALGCLQYGDLRCDHGSEGAIRFPRRGNGTGH